MRGFEMPWGRIGGIGEKQVQPGRDRFTSTRPLPARLEITTAKHPASLVKLPCVLVPASWRPGVLFYSFHPLASDNPRVLSIVNVSFNRPFTCWSIRRGHAFQADVFSAGVKFQL
jgi:hypothetical protein